MTKSVFTVNLSKAVAADLKSYIEQMTPECDRDMSVLVRTIDSISTGMSGAVRYIFEFIQNKSVCFSFATIVVAWIRARNSKGMTRKKNGYSIEFKNLTEHELFKIFSETDVSISIDDQK